MVGFGISYGVIARAAGMDALQAIVMSATTFAGSSQFAAASILGAGGGAASAFGAGVLLNSRYAPIGVSVAPYVRGGALRRFFVAQLIVDESWALSAIGGGRYDEGRLIGVGLVLYVMWTATTAVGAYGADLFGDPNVLGLDAAFPALFFALLWPQLRNSRSAAAAGIGASIAILTYPFTPPGVPIIAASLGCLLGLRRP